MSKRAWSALGALTIAAAGATYGCSGESSSSNDGGVAESGADAAQESGPTDDGGHDAGDDSKMSADGRDDSPTGDGGGGDASAGDGGASVGDGGAADGGSSDAPSDAPVWDGNTSCTPSMTCNFASDAGAVQNGVCGDGGSCGPCAMDMDCSAYGSKSICIGGSCVPGNCHSGADCAADGGTPVCVNNTCTACDGVSGNVYWVDPVTGSDSATGSASLGGFRNLACAFKTITHALSVIGSPSSATTIYLADNDASGETWPLTIPANVTLESPLGPSMVTVPSNATTGFVLGGANSGIASLSLYGSGFSSTATAGIHVVAGSAASTTIANVDVAGFTVGDGILVDGTGSKLTIGQNVGVFGNLNGLHVTGTGTVTCTTNGFGGSGAGFRSNSGWGVLVEGSGAVSFTSSPAGGIGAGGNGLGGFAFKQQGPTGSNPPNVLIGVGASSNGNGSIGEGLHLEGGSVVKVRDSSFQGNVIGVDVVASATGASPYDLSGIDLGTSSDPGKNTLQSPGTTSPEAGPNLQNTGGGVWMQLPPSQGQSLYAIGNIWSNGISPVDCTTSNPGALSVDSSACTNGVDLCGQSFSSGSTDKVYVANCTCSPSNGVCQ